MSHLEVTEDLCEAIKKEIQTLAKKFEGSVNGEAGQREAGEGGDAGKCGV